MRMPQRRCRTAVITFYENAPIRGRFHFRGICYTPRMSNLASQKCVPCEGGTPPLETARAEVMKKQINPAWRIIPATASSAMQLRCEFYFKDFIQTMKFVNKVADIAESEGHHPDLFVSYDSVTVDLWTHAVMGLSEKDFIRAAKIDGLPRQ